MLRTAGMAARPLPCRGALRQAKARETTDYLSPRVLYEHVAALARAVTAAPSLEAANTILCNLGMRTEYEFEKEMLRRGVRRYDQV